MMREIPDVIYRYAAGLKAHDVERIAGTVGEELRFVARGNQFGKAQFLEFLGALYTAFPDWQYDHDPPCWSHQMIAIRWRQSGTHSDPFVLPGRPIVAATGRRVVIPPQFFRYQINADKIIRIAPDDIAGGAPAGILDQISQ